LRKTYAFENLPRLPRFIPVAPAAPEAKSHFYILEHRERPEWPWDLVRPHDTGSSHSKRSPRGQIAPLEQDRAARRAKRSRYDAQQGRLTRTIRPDQAIDSAGLDAERHVFHSRKSCEILCDPIHTEDGGH
jgi:hypothetical protein